MRNCYIPYCDLLCRNQPKRMMFLPPSTKDEEQFQKWKAILPKTNRSFKHHDRICERHFDKEDISTTWDHVINGQLHQLERGKPKLNKTALPRLNLITNLEGLEAPKELLDRASKRKRSNDTVAKNVKIIYNINEGEKNCMVLNKNKRRKKPKNNNKNNNSNNNNDDDATKLINVLTDQKGHEVYEIYNNDNSLCGEADEEVDEEDEEHIEEEDDEEQAQDDEEASIASSCNTPVKHSNIKNNNYENSDENKDNNDNNDENDNDEISIDENNSSYETIINSKFDEIYDDIYEVVLPNTLWGIHRDPDRQFISFTYFDHARMNATKTFYVDNKFCTKILLHNLEIINETVTDLSTEYLSNLLNDIDEYRICIDINKNIAECQGVTMGKAERCFECENKLK